MNTRELTQKLTGGTTLTLSQDTLGTGFGDLLVVYNGGLPVVISDAVTETAADGSIQLTGRSSFAGVADLPLSAHVVVDAAGTLSATLRFQLRATTLTNAAPWVFSRSFPSLPTSYNHATGQVRAFLDTLDLYNTVFVLCTTAGVDAETGAALTPGLNFVSRLRPQGALGVLEHVLGDSSDLVISGLIRLPQPGDLNVALQPQEHPWDRLSKTSPPLVPGIYLSVALDVGFQAGKVSLRQTLFRIYCPVSTDWMDQNPSFGPAFGYTAKLDIPSAGISVDLGAELRWGVGQALLYGDLSGVSLGKLTQLLDLAGTDGLQAQLPAELGKAVAALDKLELSHVALDLVLSGGLPTVRTVFATVGFPNLKWKVWKDDLVVESLRCRFAVFSPFAGVESGWVSPAFRTRVATTIEGTVVVEGVPLQVSAGNEDGFVLRTSTLQPFDLPLDRLVKSRAPTVPVPSALTVNYLGLAIAPGRFYTLDTLLAGAPRPWTLAIGKEKFALSDVALHVDVPSSGSVTGQFSGTMVFADGVVLQMAWHVPGSFLMRSRLPPTKLSTVVGKLCDQTVKLPKGFDVAFGSSAVVIQDQNGNLIFQLMTEVEGLGVLAFDARKTSDGKTGFAFGLQLTGGQASRVGGLTALDTLEKALKLNKLMLVVSSMDLPGFQLPDAAQFNNPRLATKRVALPGSGGVVAGLNLFAEWTLDTNNKQQKLLMTLLGLGGTEQVTIQIPENPANGTRLFLARSGKLMGQPFQYKVGMVLEGGIPSLFLAGTVTAQISGQPQTFDLTTLFVASGAFLSASMRGSKPIDFKVFKLANVGLEVGVNWAGLPSLGVTGTIDTKNFDSSLAVFFDATNPTRSLVAGSVSDLSLKDIVDSLLGGPVSSSIDDVLHSIQIKGTQSFQLPLSLADDLDQLRLDKVSAAFLSAGKITIPSGAQQLLVSAKRRGEVWHLTDLTKMRHYQLKKVGQAITASVEAQFYFAPQATSIGSISFPAGYTLNAALEILSWRAEATIDISANRGFSVEARMDRISLGKGIFALTSADGKDGPQLSISTMAQPNHPVEAFRLPHFYLSGAVQLLGLKNSVLASLSKEGLLLELNGELAPGVEFELDVVCGKQGLAVDGDVRAGIGSIDLGDLGKIKLNTDIEGSLGIRVTGDQISAEGEASFSFLGEEKVIGRFELGTSPDALVHLADTLAKKAENLLRDEFKDAGRWANAMKNGAVDGVEDAEAVLKKTFGKSEKEAKAVAKDIGKGASSATKAVSKTASKFGKKVKKLF